MDQHANNDKMDDIVALRLALYYACYKLSAQDEELALEVMDKFYQDGIRCKTLVEAQDKKNKEASV